MPVFISSQWGWHQVQLKRKRVGWRDEWIDWQTGRETDRHTNINRDYPLCNPQFEGQSAVYRNRHVLNFHTSSMCVHLCEGVSERSSHHTLKARVSIRDAESMFLHMCKNLLCVFVYACVTGWQIDKSYTAEIRIVYLLGYFKTGLCNYQLFGCGRIVWKAFSLFGWLGAICNFLIQ